MKLNGKTINKSLRMILTLATAMILAFATVGIASADPKTDHGIGQKHSQNSQWIGSWTASPQAPYSGGISHKGFTNKTVRMIVHPHMDGKALRIRFSNTFGTKPLTFGEVHVATSAKEATIVSGSDHQVTFGGDSSITIPVGAEVLSDPVPLDVNSGQDLTISVYVPGNSGPTTWHSLSNQTSYVSSSGNHTEEAKASSFKTKVNAWFWIDGVDVKAKRSVKGAVVTLGDSITDGYNSTLNANHRWPDFLAKRFNEGPLGQQMAVLNEGISGNEILDNSATAGVSALARLDRDVFSQTGVTDVILLEGINDIGHYPHTYDADKIISGMKQIIAQAHAHGLKIYGGTLTPFKGAGGGYYTPRGEQTRLTVNHWIRTSGAFDGVIEFDKAIRDPEHPHQMLPKYDSGDHLHPNDAGYKAMAEAINLSMLSH
ncbi:MAG TPA: SGNH/GDSL hydrolase family protein [Bacillales bacterium]|nr:SGNH/GDSL hydrolase family protein [Bacillales bacterium]